MMPANCDPYLTPFKIKILLRMVYILMFLIYFEK